jgi:hypothetical protein
MGPLCPTRSPSGSTAAAAGDPTAPLDKWTYLTFRRIRLRCLGALVSTRAHSCTDSGADYRQKPKPSITLNAGSGSTSTTANEVMCRKPGSFQPHIHGRSSIGVDERPGASDSPMSVTYALGRDTAEAERLRRQTNSNPWPPSYWTESAPLRDRARSTSGAALVESWSCSPSASAPWAVS